MNCLDPSIRSQAAIAEEKIAAQPLEPALALPEEVILYTLSFLNGKELATCGLVCKHFRVLSQDNSLWKLLFRREFHNHNHLGHVSFQEAYKNCHMLSNLTKGVYASHTLTGHTKSISSLIFAEGMLFSGSFDGTIKVWDLEGNCLHTVIGRTEEITSLAFANGMLFSGSYDHTIRAWDLEGNCLHTVIGHTREISSLVFANGMLCSGSFDGTIKVWDLEGNCLHTLTGHRVAITSLFFANGMLFSGSYDHTIKVWDLEGNCLHTLTGHTNKITSLAFANGMLFSGSYDRTIRAWDLEGNCLHTVTGHRAPITSLVFANGMLFSSSYDHIIKVWDLEGNCLHTLTGGCTDGIRPLAFANGMLFSGSYDHTIKVRDFKATNNAIFEELAHLLKSGDPDAVKGAMERFLRMPPQARNKIYAELYIIIKCSLTNDYWGCAEHAFHDQYGQSSTPAQKAEAIELYLAHRS